MSQQTTSRIAKSMTSRRFSQGGYQEISEPTLITYYSTVIGTFIPGELIGPVTWEPSGKIGAALDTPVSPGIDLTPRQLADFVSPARVAYFVSRQESPLTSTSELPGWLTAAASQATAAHPTSRKSRLSTHRDAANPRTATPREENKR